MDENGGKKKILYLITKSNFGGAQRYVYDLALNFSKEHEVVVALGGEGVLINKLKSSGIEVIQIPGLQRDISLKKELGSLKQIWKIIRNEKPDVLHVNSSKAGGIGAFCGRLLGVRKIIYTAHGWAFNEDRSSFSRFIIAFLHWLTILLSHTTITVSHAMKEQMLWPFTKNKMVVIHPGREAENLLYKEKATEIVKEKVAEPSNFKEASLKLVTIAELHPIKNLDVAIKATARLRETYPNIAYFIIGEGEDRTRLESLIKELDLEENVYLLGFVENATQLLPAFDIFLFPSKSEAFGYVLVEAGQAKLPVIASEVGGIKDIITNKKNGLLVRPGKVEDLAKNIEILVNSSEDRERLGETLQNSVVQFSLRKMLSDTIAIYKQ